MPRSSFLRGVLVALVATITALVAVGHLAPAASALPTTEERIRDVDRDRFESVPLDDTGETGSRSATASPAALDPGQNIEFVALSPTCRMIDTRKSGGFLAAGASRDFSALNPCSAIPENAVAVDVSLSTIGGTPSNSGFAQVGPALSTPSATVLQYLKNQGTSVTTTIPLEFGGIRVKANGGGTHLAIDVLGYWQRTMHASIAPDGDDPDTDPDVFAASGLVTLGTDPETPGLYFLEFDRDISPCSVAASPEAFQDTQVTRVTAGIGVDEFGSFVMVDIRSYNGTEDVDGAFELVVEC